MTHTTQCPDCQTCFKVNSSQLAVANGLVRCGRCSRVFNAQEHLVQIELPRLHDEAHTTAAPSIARPNKRSAAPAVASVWDDFQLEVPDFDPQASDFADSSGNEIYAHGYHSASTDSKTTAPHADHAAEEPRYEDIEAFQRTLTAALHQPAINTPIGNPFADELLTLTPNDSVPSDIAASNSIRGDTLAGHPALTIDQDGYVPASFHARSKSAPSRKKSRRWLNGVFILLSTIGLIALIGQLIFFNRARIATEIPELRPTLDRACEALGCTVPLPTDLQFIRTEWSDCPQLPDHPNILQLQAKIKNRAPYPQAWPMMELTLKDTDNRILIRKVFTPREYLKTDDYNIGRFHANSEAFIDILFDSGQVRPRGYSIYWFYP